MIDPKEQFRLPYKVLFDTKRSDEHGSFQIQLLDFARARTGQEVRVPANHKRIGWVLICDVPTPPTPEAPLGSRIADPNEPLVGSEETHHLALDRAEGVRAALVLPLIARQPSHLWRIECAGCGASIDDPTIEPCTICGRPVCEACGEKNNGVCGKDVVVDQGEAVAMSLNDRSIERSSEVQTAHAREVHDRAHRLNPMAQYVRTVANETPAIAETSAEIADAVGGDDEQG